MLSKIKKTLYFFKDITAKYFFNNSLWRLFGFLLLTGFIFIESYGSRFKPVFGKIKIFYELVGLENLFIKDFNNLDLKVILFHFLVFIQIGILFYIIEKNIDGITPGKLVKKLFNNFNHRFLFNVVTFILFLALLVSFIMVYTIPFIYYYDLNYFFGIINHDKISLIPEAVFLFLISISLNNLLTNKKINLFNKNSESSPGDSSIFFDDEPHENITRESYNYPYVNNLFNIIESMKNNKKFLSIALNGMWGSGKTSVLKTLKTKLDHTKDYHVIWIEAWKLRDFKKIITELERNFLKFVKKSLFFTPKEIYSYFSMINEFNPDKRLKNIFSGFISRQKHNGLNENNRITQQLIEKSLKHQNKKKIVIIFDDVDRIIDKEECIFLLKAIRYVMGFEGVLTVAGLDLYRVNNIINSKINNHQEYDSSFLYKIFSCIVEINSDANQDKIVSFLISAFEKKSLLFFQKYSNVDNGFNDTVEISEINNTILKFIKEEFVYDLFLTYREIKLTLNDFFQTLLYMKQSSPEFYIHEMINPLHVFLMSVLKNINSRFFYKFLFNIDSYLDANHYHYLNMVEDYVKKSLLIENNENTKDKVNAFTHSDSNGNMQKVKDKRVERIFALLGVNLGAVDYRLYSKIHQEVFVDLSIVLTKNVLDYYKNPSMQEYQFSNRNIKSHIDRLFSNEITEEDYVINFYKKFEELNGKNLLNGNVKKTEMLIDYLEKSTNFLNQEILDTEKNNRSQVYKVVSVFLQNIIDLLINKFSEIYDSDIIHQIMSNVFSVKIFPDSAIKEIFLDVHLINKICQLMKNTQFINYTVNSFYYTYFTCRKNEGIDYYDPQDIVSFQKNLEEQFIGKTSTKTESMIFLLRIVQLVRGNLNELPGLPVFFINTIDFILKNEQDILQLYNQNGAENSSNCDTGNIYYLDESFKSFLETIRITLTEKNASAWSAANTIDEYFEKYYNLTRFTLKLFNQDSCKSGEFFNTFCLLTLQLLSFAKIKYGTGHNNYKGLIGFLDDDFYSNFKERIEGNDGIESFRSMIRSNFNYPENKTVSFKSVKELIENS